MLLGPKTWSGTSYVVGRPGVRGSPAEHSALHREFTTLTAGPARAPPSSPRQFRTRLCSHVMARTPPRTLEAWFMHRGCGWMFMKIKAEGCWAGGSHARPGSSFTWKVAVLCTSVALCSLLTACWRGGLDTPLLGFWSADRRRLKVGCERRALGSCGCWQVAVGPGKACSHHAWVLVLHTWCRPHAGCSVPGAAWAVRGQALAGLMCVSCGPSRLHPGST